jgi:apolipoprotein N-acyltransferase
VFGAPADGGVPIAVVQPNLDLGSQWKPEMYGRNLDVYLRLTAETLGHDPPPRLVVWPESALSFFLDDEPLYRAAIAHVLEPAGTELIAGGPRTAGVSEPPFHNATFLLRPDGEIAAWYDKRRLLPFAEFFPWQSAGLLRRQFGRVREFTAGEPRPPLPTVAGRAGVIVCNEALFPEPARERVRAGATLLLALTNDSWVGEPKYAAQATAMTVVRAIEQRRPLVRASTAGPSVIVTPAGEVVARTAAFAAATLDGVVVPRGELTPYARLGDLFAAASALVALAACVRAR